MNFRLDDLPLDVTVLYNSARDRWTVEAYLYVGPSLDVELVVGEGASLEEAFKKFARNWKFRSEELAVG